jgi:hypothetical protein
MDTNNRAVGLASFLTTFSGIASATLAYAKAICDGHFGIGAKQSPI